MAWRDVTSVSAAAKRNPKLAAALDHAGLHATAGQRPRHVAGEMNKTEAAYYAELCRRTDLLSIEFETRRLTLAPRTTYRPDFWCIRKDGTEEAHEVKGHMEDDAAVKLKVAAVMFPDVEFYLVRRSASRTMPTFSVKRVPSS